MMKKIFLFVLIITISSCSYLGTQGLDKTYIRIVDSNGKPKKIKTFPPELNVRYLAAQEREKYDIYHDKTYSRSDVLQSTTKQRIDNNITNNLAQKDQILPDSNISKSQYNSNQKPIYQEKQKKSTPITYKLNGQDLNQDQFKINNDQKKSPITNKRKVVKIKKGDLLIQIASFSNNSKALAAQRKENIRNSRVISVKLGKKTYHKLVVGPFSSKKNGNKTLNNLKGLGYKDAFYYKFK